MDQVDVIISQYVARFPVQYRDDLKQECWLKVFPLLAKHDPAKSGLRTFLYVHIKGACIRWMKNNVEKHSKVQPVENFQLIDPETVL
ncbi:sigma factor [Maribacter dokdonensis]|uniref:sigma factor n=1 Tax=Maribacter dokdonensis TaxID=320912 RepID=UPI000B873D1B|nr:sigma factor [Maribacter dokdonensis]